MNILTSPGIYTGCCRIHPLDLVYSSLRPSFICTISGSKIHIFFTFHKKIILYLKYNHQIFQMYQWLITLRLRFRSKKNWSHYFFLPFSFLHLCSVYSVSPQFAMKNSDWRSNMKMNIRGLLILWKQILALASKIWRTFYRV